MSQRPRGRRPVQEITEPQHRTLKEIRLFTNRRGFPPTMKGLMGPLGVSHASVHGQVNQFVRKGCLKREARRARGMVILRHPEEDVPHLVAVPIGAGWRSAHLGRAEHRRRGVTGWDDGIGTSNGMEAS